jgi:hypothetical protein
MTNMSTNNCSTSPNHSDERQHAVSSSLNILDTIVLPEQFPLMFPSSRYTSPQDRRRLLIDVIGEALKVVHEIENEMARSSHSPFTALSEGEGTVNSDNNTNPSCRDNGFTK